MEGPENKLIKAPTEPTRKKQHWLFLGLMSKFGGRRVLSKQYLSVAILKVGDLSLIYFLLLTTF